MAYTNANKFKNSSPENGKAPDVQALTKIEQFKTSSKSPLFVLPFLTLRGICHDLSVTRSTVLHGSGHFTEVRGEGA